MEYCTGPGWRVLLLTSTYPPLPSPYKGGGGVRGVWPGAGCVSQEAPVHVPVTTPVMRGARLGHVFHCRRGWSFGREQFFTSFPTIVPQRPINWRLGWAAWMGGGWVVWKCSMSGFQISIPPIQTTNHAAAKSNGMG